MQGTFHHAISTLISPLVKPRETMLLFHVFFIFLLNDTQCTSLRGMGLQLTECSQVEKLAGVGSIRTRNFYAQMRRPYLLEYPRPRVIGTTYPPRRIWVANPESIALASALVGHTLDNPLSFTTGFSTCSPDDLYSNLSLVHSNRMPMIFALSVGSASTIRYFKRDLCLPSALIVS